VESTILIEDYESSSKYCDIMKQADDGCCNGCGAFFLDFRERTLNGYSDLFGEGLETNTLVQKPNSTKDGDGTTPSIPSLKVMLEDLMRYQASPSPMPYLPFL
jgi:hypothetical protein